MDIQKAQNLLNKAIKKRISTSVKTLKELFYYFIENQIVIYGAGNFGQKIFHALSAEKIKISAFIDKNTGVNTKLFKIPVLKPENIDLDKSKTVVVLCLVQPDKIRKEIKKNLKNVGFKEVVDAWEIYPQVIFPYDEFNIEPDINIIKSESDNIKKALLLLEDDRSRTIYLRNITSHFERKYKTDEELIDGIQYYPKDIIFQKGYSRFVDCGAYTGDSLDVLANYCTIEAYIGFEPDLKNFSTLSNNLTKRKSKELLCFPSAVYSKTKMLRFDDGLGSSSKISDVGENSLLAVSLDDVLINFCPTMIKMDIEGAEIDALKGSVNIIQYNKPDLAICIYHKVSDMWKVPLLIDSWKLGYKFYIRAHHSDVRETVLYSTIV